MVIAVGDIITMALERNGFIPDVKIIDFRSRRQQLTDPAAALLPASARDLRAVEGPSARATRQFKYINNPGTINTETVYILQSAIKKYFQTGQKPSFVPLSGTSKGKQTIVIDGEEDLLALPAILLAPRESVVLYGQMGLGVIIIEVTEQKKEKIKKLLEKFD